MPLRRRGLTPGSRCEPAYELPEPLDDDRDDELDDPPLDELPLDELLELPVLDDELDDELDSELDDELDVLLVLDELLESELDELLERELDELLEGVLDELDDAELPPVGELPVLLDGDPSGEVGRVVQPASPAAITAMGAPANSSKKSRRCFRSAASGWLTVVLRGRVGMTVLH